MSRKEVPCVECFEIVRRIWHMDNAFWVKLPHTEVKESVNAYEKVMVLF